MKRIVLFAVMVMMVAGCDWFTEAASPNVIDVYPGNYTCNIGGMGWDRLTYECPGIRADLKRGEAHGDRIDHLESIIRYCSPEVLAGVRGYMERGEEYEVEIEDHLCCSRNPYILCIGGEYCKTCTVHYTGPVTPAMKTKLKEMVE
jgi:hypothetical protein